MGQFIERNQYHSRRWTGKASGQGNMHNGINQIILECLSFRPESVLN